MFGSANCSGEIPDLSKPFTITCPSGTDLWEKPPSVHAKNAPYIYRTTRISSLVSAKVTVSAEWAQKYDQGGLCLIVGPDSQERRWVKTGIEFLDGQPHVSTVATYKWSDWSLRPTTEQNAESTTIEIESNEDGSLWVYVIAKDGTKSPIREVTWWGDLDKKTECWIGVYAAKPSTDPASLEVSFMDLEIKVLP